MHRPVDLRERSGAARRAFPRGGAVTQLSDRSPPNTYREKPSRRPSTPARDELRRQACRLLASWPRQANAPHAGRRIGLGNLDEGRDGTHRKHVASRLAMGPLKSVGFSAALALILASAYVEVRDENRRSRRGSRSNRAKYWRLEVTKPYRSAACAVADRAEAAEPQEPFCKRL